MRVLPLHNMHTAELFPAWRLMRHSHLRVDLDLLYKRPCVLSFRYVQIERTARGLFRTPIREMGNKNFERSF